MEIKTSADTADRKEEIMSEPKSQEQISLEKDYEEYVKRITPTHNLFLQMLKAFITGGIICVTGQFLLNFAGNTLGMDKDMSGSFCSLVLVLISVLLTGFNIYPSIVKFGPGSHHRVCQLRSSSCRGI